MNFMPHLMIAASQATDGENAGLLQALGIDWRLLLLQSAAFLVLVFLLGKFVFPILIRSIDKRQEQLEAGARASEDAQKKAEKAQEELTAQLKEARKAADDIVANAQREAADMVATAEKRAEAKAKHIVDEARESLKNDTAAARTALRKETVSLVALATEKIIGQKLDTGKDAALIDRALKDAER